MSQEITPRIIKALTNKLLIVFIVEWKPWKAKLHLAKLHLVLCHNQNSKIGVTSGYFGASNDNFVTTLPIHIRYPCRTPENILRSHL